MSIPRRDVTSYLESLGSTPDEVARNLQSLGIRGLRRDCQTCPIANALELKFPQYGFSVAPDTVRVLSEHDTMTLFSVETPHAVWGFILKFDMDGYPGLSY